MGSGWAALRRRRVRGRWWAEARGSRGGEGGDRRGAGRHTAAFGLAGVDGVRGRLRIVEQVVDSAIGQVGSPYRVELGRRVPVTLSALPTRHDAALARPPNSRLLVVRRRWCVVGAGAAPGRPVVL